MKRTPDNSLTRGATRSLASAPTFLTFAPASASTFLTFALAFTTFAFAFALLASASLEARAQGAPPPPVVVVVTGDESAGGAHQQKQQPAAQATPLPDGPKEGARTREARDASASGSIKGRVVGDAGEPVAGASVTLSPRGTNQQAYRAQRTVTDDEGNFTLTGLDPGLYSVGANSPGYFTDVDPSTNRPTIYRPGDAATVRLVKGGAVTGTVTDPQGEPLVSITVRAYRLRDLDGRTYGFGGYNFEDNTDDRGVYRIYGLPPGVYIVSAGSSGRGYYPGWASAYEGNVLTFYPSATRDTASELTVRAGQENAGVDIRYRDEPGRRVTGSVVLPAGSPPEAGVSVSLYYANTNTQAHTTFISPTSDTRAFSIEGVADGDYDAQALINTREGPLSAAAPQRVSVRGADVTGLRLTLAPLASVSGTLVVEQASAAERASEACKEQRASKLPQETLVTLAADRSALAKGQAASRTSAAREVAPDASGAFTLRAIEAGRYRVGARPFDEALYVRSIQLPAQAPAPNANAARAGAPAAAHASAAVAAPSRDAIDVRSGQQLSGVTVRLSEGAALLSGRVAVQEGAPAPPFSLMPVHLLPAERESADDPLRYFEATPDASGLFVFRNLPPGRYMLVARPASEPDAAGTPPRPAHWDAESRLRLRRDAEAANSPVELQPCQRASDFTLHFPK
jgi:Carboxypeptidase regulatory-like domain